MPTLLNPLDKFQSYSIHHILLGCRTTEDAKDFTNESKNGDTIAAINEVTQLGEAIPYGTAKETAYLIMDTRRFSQFSVDNMKYEVWINGLDKTGGSTANVAATMSMTIMDSVGISFINFIQWLMNEKMQTNFDGLIFMHRLLFVGLNYDGTAETVQSVTIPLMLNKLELNLDYAKGAYSVEWQPVMNFDTTKHQRWLNISSATRYFTGKGGEANNNLGTMVANFEAQLNNASASYFDKAQKEFAAAGRIKDGKKFGRQVRYMLTVPKEWEIMRFDGSSVGSATETIFAKLTKEQKDAQAKTAADAKKTDDEAKKATPPKSKIIEKAGTPKDSHLSVEIGTTITHVLDTILSQVKGIAELGAGTQTTGPGGSVTFYKHHVGITSNDDIVIVHVDVVPFRVPNIFIDKNKKEQSTAVTQYENDFYQPMSDGTRIPRNYAEFDYIFTGKNKDILNFDLKLQDLQFMLAQNLNLGPTSVGLPDNGTPGAKKETTPDLSATLINTRAYDAILLPRNTEDELANFGKYTKMLKDDQSFIDVGRSQNNLRNISMFYAMSPIAVNMTIRGNPLIMAKFNKSSFLPHLVLGTANAEGKVSLTSTKDRHSYRDAFDKAMITNNSHLNEDGGVVKELKNENGTFTVANTLGSDSYTRSPVFVKVNVKGPKVDFRTGKQRDLVDGEFGETLLENNFFVVMQVTNIIEGQNFKQELQLYSHNVFGQGKLFPQTEKKI